MKLEVWWIPQVPGSRFLVPVESVPEAAKILETLGRYDAFQLEHNIRGDYCNVGGLMQFDEHDTTDGSSGSWVDWYDEETGEDDPVRWHKDYLAKTHGE